MTPHNPSHKSRALIRLRAWARRYGASELVGTLTAYVGYFTALGMTQNHVAAAYGGSIGESLGFFGVMIIREIAADRAKAKRRLGCYGPKEISATIRGLFLEFGPAELLDTGLIGPLAMGTAWYYLGPWIGILLGKLASDIAFYGYAIFASEMRKKWARAKAKNQVSARLASEEPQGLNDIVETLLASEPFSSVPREDLEFLSTMFEHRHFADAEVICRRGDEAKEFYVIKDGQVEIKDCPDSPTVTTLGRSAVIGEYGLFTGSKRTATIIAKGSVRLLALDYEHFERFMLAFPEGTIALLKTSVLRYVEIQRAMQSRLEC